MQFHSIIYWVRHTHSMTERKLSIQRPKNKTYKNKPYREKRGGGELSCPPAGDAADTMRTSQRNMTNYCTQSKRLRTEGNSRQTEAQPPLGTTSIAAAVCGTSIFISIASSIHLLLVPTLPAVPLLLSSTSPHPRRGCVRQRETSEAGSSSTHATRLLSWGLKGRNIQEVTNRKSRRIEAQ